MADSMVHHFKYILNVFFSLNRLSVWTDLGNAVIGFDLLVFMDIVNRFLVFKKSFYFLPKWNEEEIINKNDDDHDKSLLSKYQIKTDVLNEIIKYCQAHMVVMLHSKLPQFRNAWIQRNLSLAYYFTYIYVYS